MIRKEVLMKVLGVLAVAVSEGQTDTISAHNTHGEAERVDQSKPLVVSCFMCCSIFCPVMTS